MPIAIGHAAMFCTMSYAFLVNPAAGTSRTPPTAVSSNESGTVRQGEAVSALKKLGATIRTDVRGRAVSVGLFNTRISSDQLKQLGTLTDIETLDLQDANVTSSGLKNLRRFKKLKFLNLFGTKVTKAEAGALRKSLPDCEILR